MARFIPKRLEQIFVQMIARVVARSGLSNVSDASVFKHLLAAAARQDDEQYFQMSSLLTLFNMGKCRGEDLDERGKDVQPTVVSRLAASKSVGQVVFTRAGTSGSVTIPIGTKVKAGDKVFSTTTTGLVTPTSVEQISGNGVGRDSNLVSVIADEAGIAGDVDAGTVLSFVSKPAGIDEVTNPSAFSLGRDRQSDADYYNAIQSFIRSLARCPPSSIEGYLLGKTDPSSGKTILYAAIVEDQVNPCKFDVYVDDGTGQVEAFTDVATAIVEVLTWDGTTTVEAVTDTSEAIVGDWIRLDADGQWFEITAITPGDNFTILNPGADTIPTGATQSSKATDILTEGFDPSDEAVGGETVLNTDFFPVKDSLPFRVTTDVQGNLVEITDYVLNPTSGQIVLTTALVAGEQVVAGYTRYTGLIAYAQTLVDGDPADRVTFPGYRAAGTRGRILAPQVLIQPVTMILTIADGFDRDTVIANVEQAVLDHVNGLTVSGDLLRANLFAAGKAVDGVTNLVIPTPAADVIILDDQLARTTAGNLDVS